jgi:hypothetical protein
MKVVIKASKTDTFRQGSVLTIARSSRELCAVQAMRDYLRATNHSGPLFILLRSFPDKSISLSLT